MLTLRVLLTAAAYQRLGRWITVWDRCATLQQQQHMLKAILASWHVPDETSPAGTPALLSGR